MNYTYDQPPVREGEELDVEIIALGDKGDGIAKKEGFVLVIPGARVGDQVRIKVTKVLRKVGFAELAGEAAETSQEATDEDSENPVEEATEEGSSEKDSTEETEPAEKEFTTDF